MKSWTTKEGTEIYRILSLPANVYLVRNEGRQLLVDTSTKLFYRTLRKRLDKFSFGNGESDCLVLTHTHYDHCQNVAAVKEETACRIIVSKEAEEAVATGYTPPPAGTMPLTRLLISVGKRTANKNFAYRPFKADDMVTKEYRLFDNDNIKIIPTPGHSADSMSIIVDNEIALVGDAMFGIFISSIYPPFCDDTAEMLKSWAKLTDTGCTLFLPGHGSPISLPRLLSQYQKHNR
ncbi:MAG: MBL fold metallo-hydrolase [Bacteroidales bacterium]|nr:MBL fold metallo-hydrolase [Bacteroidales bacterium]